MFLSIVHVTLVKVTQVAVFQAYLLLFILLVTLVLVTSFPIYPSGFVVLSTIFFFWAVLPSIMSHCFYIGVHDELALYNLFSVSSIDATFVAFFVVSVAMLINPRDKGSRCIVHYTPVIVVSPFLSPDSRMISVLYKYDSLSYRLQLYR